VTEFTSIDYVIFAATAIAAAMGLFRGLSGELGSFAGFGAAAAAGFLLYPAACALAGKFGVAEGSTAWAGGVLDLTFALLAYGLTRRLVSKFVSLMVPQPTNSILGAVGGAAKGAALVAVLAGTGILQGGTCSQGFFAERSLVVRTVAGWIDARAAGAWE